MTAISIRWLALALTLVPYAIPALAAGTDDPDWPCVQRLMPELSAGAVWAGPSIENAAKLWRNKPAVQSLVARIAARRTPVEEGVGAIEAFAKTLGVEKDATLFFTAPAFADHRPGNVVVMGGQLHRRASVPCALSRAHSPNRRPRNSRATSADP